MAEQFTSFIVENDKAFRDEINRISRSVSDFRIPFGLIANDFFKSNRKLFTLKGPGLYDDFGGLNPGEHIPFQGELLSRRDAYRLRKKREVGFAYPIMVREGKLAGSLLSRNAEGSEFSIGKDELVLGTNIKYAIYHQSGKLQRKVVFIDGGPAERARDSSIAGRRERWFNILRTHEKQVLTGKV